MRDGQFLCSWSPCLCEEVYFPAKMDYSQVAEFYEQVGIIHKKDFAITEHMCSNIKIIYFSTGHAKAKKR